MPLPARPTRSKERHGLSFRLAGWKRRSDGRKDAPKRFRMAHVEVDDTEVRIGEVAEDQESVLVQGRIRINARIERDRMRSPTGADDLIHPTRRGVVRVVLVAVEVRHVRVAGDEV